mgnify:CR=1 FL=1
MITTLKVLAYRYKVKPDARMAEKYEADALHDPRARTIWYDPGVGTRPENDIMHEVFESAKWQMDYSDKELPHQMLTALASVVCAVLHDNREFTRMFL